MVTRVTRDRTEGGEEGGEGEEILAGGPTDERRGGPIKGSTGGPRGPKKSFCYCKQEMGIKVISIFENLNFFRNRRFDYVKQGCLVQQM